MLESINDIKAQVLDDIVEELTKLQKKYEVLGEVDHLDDRFYFGKMIACSDTLLAISNKILFYKGDK